MKRLSILCSLFALALSAGAQTAFDPVLMTINGKDVTKGEFEYSYHKNGSVEGAVEQKSVEEYVPMFINYKLKVAEAEAQRLDTLSSFKREFLTYRDMQLTPYLIDQSFVDSVAHVVYNNTNERLGGKELIQTSHILLRLGQKATDAEKTSLSNRADSIYSALMGGADFADLARRYSGDPGSANKGGQLPMVAPGTFVKEFEDAAYALKEGEISRPVLSPFGYHIIRMDKRKRFGTFEENKADILTYLKSINIEEQSSEHRIKEIVDASNGRLTREAVLDSVMNAHINNDAQLRYLIQEYHDGLLLYEVSKREVWDVCSLDTAGLEAYYKKHKKQYAWTEPRFKGFVYHCKDASQEKAVKKMLKKYAKTNWREQLKEQFNKDSVTVSVSGPYICKQGENRFADAYAFKVNAEKAKVPRGYALSGVYGKLLKKPQSFYDVKAQVTADYQSDTEKTWVESLRRKYTFSVNEAILNTVK